MSDGAVAGADIREGWLYGAWWSSPREEVMRARFALAVLCGALVTGAAGCGGGGEASTATPAQHSTTAQQQTTKAAEPFDLAACFEKAGAKIATSPADLSFAKGKSVLSGAENDAAGELPDGTATYSVKSRDSADTWHIYSGQ